MYSILQFNAISCHSPVSRQPAVCIQYKPAERAGQQFVLFDSTQPGDQKTCRASKCNIVQLIFHIEIKLLDKQLKLSNSYLNWKRCLYLSVCTYLKILLIAGPIWFSLIMKIIIGLGKGFYLRCCSGGGGGHNWSTITSKFCLFLIGLDSPSLSPIHLCAKMPVALFFLF